MNVRDLIKELLKYDLDTHVLLAKDPEGNRFWQVSELGFAWFDAVYGYEPRETDEEDATKVVVIWP